jgi:hypothetical protein
MIAKDENLMSSFNHSIKNFQFLDVIIDLKKLRIKEKKKKRKKDY